MNRIFSPFEQFEVSSYFDISWAYYNRSFTNSAWAILRIVGVWVFLFRQGLNSPGIVPTKLQGALEIVYLFILALVKEHLGKSYIMYFPFILTLFTFILGGNVLGIVPFSFTITSHICITFGLSFSICVGILILGLVQHGTHFFSCFLPAGAPLAMAPLFISIELVSYSSHAVSLAVRLFANILAGHALLKILAGFVWTMWGRGGVMVVASVAPLGVVFAITVLEIGIAFLQAYVFTILSCIYLKDSIHLH